MIINCENGFLEYNLSSPEIDIVNIFVEEKFRRQGIASKLLTELTAKYPDHTIFLEVRKSNIPAINLYRKFGFEQYNVRKKYYTNPTEDAYALRLKSPTNPHLKLKYP
ncbi:MAG: GNAT family N-acetyltransferase [Ruminococcus sp.]|jgi:ribosomal-protein-alanine N-acetyltransferase|nr:GNAT family N-acetyltransferase [Ruminococcus sp.]